MLMVLAASSATMARINTGRGNLWRNAPPRPRPLAMPMRAHIICTAAINGQVRSAVHNMALPRCAPATE